MITRIILFEDNVNLRESLRLYLEQAGDYVVVADFGSCERADEIVAMLRPDLVIMDIGMPGVSGIEGVRMIKEAYPETQVIIYTVFEDEDKLFDSLCAGASGYILKNASFTYLHDAIRELHDGGVPMSPAIAQKVLQYFRQQAGHQNKYGLSGREMDVLRYLVKGYSYKMIADACHVALATVQFHIRNIYHKLHVNCGREAVIKALKDKIV
ncbi:LuxR family two component transcriptional regulator [Thermoflavifilum aggregans]|uniref:LuxR family two component transcriptional regulator n=1 Tax=Thermoflavifilum aggregans TaxID=454188 RepID=A0A2M9CWE6_9BACT|nr:response regulator transcription factor [Thermoflavifilum aggregans]PJJ76128.1 LuxR family two component transcriptional regulator [Thermoflavifilum aggregans]